MWCQEASVIIPIEKWLYNKCQVSGASTEERGGLKTCRKNQDLIFCSSSASQFLMPPTLHIILTLHKVSTRDTRVRGWGHRKYVNTVGSQHTHRTLKIPCSCPALKSISLLTFYHLLLILFSSWIYSSSLHPNCQSDRNPRCVSSRRFPYWYHFF